jgi:hypothetical protein
MNTHSISKGLRAAALSALAAAALLPFQANAASPGGHAAAGFHGGGSSGYHGGYGYRGGYGYHGGYGYRGYGYRGGYGYYGWRPGFGWGWWGWPIGAAFLATLPFYYSTLWWNGVPYYYTYDNYYVWSNSADGYVAVTPPPEVMSQASATAPPAASAAGAAPGGAMSDGAAMGATLFAYPKNGQSPEQVTKDRQECQAWAGTQASNGGSDNVRAQTACLEARGYSVR